MRFFKTLSLTSVHTELFRKNVYFALLVQDDDVGSTKMIENLLGFSKSYNLLNITSLCIRKFNSGEAIS